MKFVVSSAVRLWCRWVVSRRVQVEFEGLEHVPRAGPVLVVSRHVHHVYDGVIYLSVLRRGTSILLALDWVPARWLRVLMELACSVAGWPTVLRVERLMNVDAASNVGFRSAYSIGEARGYLQKAVRRSISLLRRGDILVVFPEAYPRIDPMAGPRDPDAEFLPFRRGFVHLVRDAQRDGRSRVCVVPAGLRYEGGAPWRVWVSFGPGLALESGDRLEDFARKVEGAVHELSSPHKFSGTYRQE